MSILIYYLGPELDGSSWATAVVRRLFAASGCQQRCDHNLNHSSIGTSATSATIRHLIPEEPLGRRSVLVAAPNLRKTPWVGDKYEDATATSDVGPSVLVERDTGVVGSHNGSDDQCSFFGWMGL